MWYPSGQVFHISDRANSFRGVNVNIGQRYSVVIRTNQIAGNYLMRATLPTLCFLPFVPYNSSGLDSAQYHVLGVLLY
jgi:hypothetical protein